MRPDKIKVMVADDSQVIRALLVQMLNAAPGMEVVGTVADGQAALDYLANGGDRPDVLLMDIHMPRLDGFEATRRIMETCPLPIVICTATSDPREMVTAFRSIEAGAVACVEKPVSAGPDCDARRDNLLQTVRLMSEVKVVRRWNRTRPAAGPVPIASTGGSAAAGGGFRIVGLGASTGGPPVLQTILSGLPKTFPVPLLIVQHIARGFLPGMVEWLNETTGVPVHIATHGVVPQPGHAYVAPDDLQMGADPRGHLVLANGPPEHGLRPAVSFLFRSLAKGYGSTAIGVLLTGMGKDGAAELKLMRDSGSCTIAQDRDSSIVHGMPGEAIELGAAMMILPAQRIAHALSVQVNYGHRVAGAMST
jgi:two-component system chemotaxis response regulator CheB